MKKQFSILLLLLLTVSCSQWGVPRGGVTDLGHGFYFKGIVRKSKGFERWSHSSTFFYRDLEFRDTIVASPLDISPSGRYLVYWGLANNTFGVLLFDTTYRTHYRVTERYCFENVVWDEPHARFTLMDVYLVPTQHNGVPDFERTPIGAGFTQTYEIEKLTRLYPYKSKEGIDTNSRRSTNGRYK